MSLTKPPKDRAMRPGDAKTKHMERVKVKIVRPFKYNGQFVEAGQEVEMNEDRAVNHMRVGDVERNEDLIKKIKERRAAAADAAKADAQKDW